MNFGLNSKRRSIRQRIWIVLAKLKRKRNVTYHAGRLYVALREYIEEHEQYCVQPYRQYLGA